MMLTKLSRAVITKHMLSSSYFLVRNNRQFRGSPSFKWSSYWQRLQQTLKLNGIFGNANNTNETIQDFNIPDTCHTSYDISNLAMQYHLNNETEQANALYLTALSKDKMNGDLNFYYAHFLMHCQQNYELSLKYAHTAIKCKNVSPPLASPYILLAQIYGMTHKLQLAEKYINIAVNEIGDDNCNAFFNYAQTLNMLRNYESCIEFLHFASNYHDENNPHHPTKNEINLLINSCYIQLKDFENAIKFTKQSADTNIYDNLRIVYEHLHNSNKYKNDAEIQENFYLDDIEQNENDFYSNIFYAKYLISKERANDALKYLHKAKEIDPKHYVSYYYKALALYFSGYRMENINEIVDLFNYVLDSEPTEINCYVYLATLSTEMAEYDQALEYLEKGIEINADTNLLQFNYALTLLRLQSMDDYDVAMQKTIDSMKQDDGQINPQLFYVKNEIYNVNNIINTRVDVYKEFGDFYLNKSAVDYRAAVHCYLCGLDEIAVCQDYRLEEYLFISVASCYLNIKKEKTNMKRYCLMGLNKYPKSAQLNFLYSQYLFQFAESYILALKYLDITMQLEPDNLYYYLIKANIYHNRLYDNPNALQCVNKVLALTDKKDPLHAEAREYLFQFTSLTKAN